MQVVLSSWNESTTCTWCEKERECVTASFEDKFLSNSPLCWKCLQTAFKVRSRQQPDRKPTDEKQS